MKLNKSIIEIRVELQETKLKKSGKNKFAGFEYYELSDFLPTLNKLMLNHNMNDIFSIENEEAKLTLVLEDEMQVYKIPFTQYMTPNNNSGKPSMQDIQYLGALNTYYKRYLYLNAFGITDGEVIDSMDNENIVKPQITTPSQSTLGISDAQVKEINNLLEETESDVVKFLGVFKVDAVSNMTSGAAIQAINTLNIKKSKMGETK